MLILSRRIGETIQIGEDIQVIVMDNQRGQVKIGIKAPKSITVYRQEIYEKIQQELTEVE